MKRDPQTTEYPYNSKKMLLRNYNKGTLIEETIGSDAKKQFEILIKGEPEAAKK